MRRLVRPHMKKQLSRAAFCITPPFYAYGALGPGGPFAFQA